MSHQIQIFAGSASKALAIEIAEYLKLPIGQLEIQRFSDGEMQPRFGESIRGNDVFLVQSTNPPAENLLELLLIIDAARRASANSITVVIPYFGYARQDRKDRPRVSIGSKLVANVLVASGANRVVTADLHAGQIQGFFDIPLDNLDAAAVFIPYFLSQNITDLVIASPDMGGVTRARMFAKHLKADLVLVDKMRERANQVASMQLIGSVEGKNVIIVDDIIDTGGTLCKSAEHLIEKGAKTVRAAITHPILSGPAYDRINNSVLTELIVTNTISLKSESPRIKVLSIAPLFGQALDRIYNFESVSSLFL
jgi:ribose-phosphate pyrophosphokinase